MRIAFSPLFASLVSGGLLVAFAACGSDSDTPAPIADASVPDGSIVTACAADTTCVAGRCSVVLPAGLGGAVTIAELPVPSELAADTLGSVACTLASTRPIETSLRLSVGVSGMPPDAILVRADSGDGVAVESSTVNAAAVVALVNEPGVYVISARAKDPRVTDAVANDPLSSGDTPSLLRNLSQQPMAAAWFDGTRYYVGDGPRVLVYAQGAPTPRTKPTLVLGQPDVDTILPGTSASLFSGNVNAIWSDGTKLVVAETSRVLVWNAIPTKSFTPADVVLGQQDFVSATPNNGGISASTVWSPRGLDSDGERLVVADTLNHRALAWSRFPTSVGQPATTVLGQPTFSSADPGTLYQPWAVALDGVGAFVANAYAGASHFASLTTNQPPDFYAVDPSYPLRIRANVLQGATSITKLPGDALAMTTNQIPRICVLRAIPNAASACDFVLGQPNPDRAVYSTVSNPVTGSSLSGAAKVLSSHGVTLIADTSRVLVYEHTPAFNADPPDRVIGQAGFSVNERADHRRTSASSLASPADVATNGTVVAVADRGNNRVLLFDAGTLAASGANAAVVLGQPDVTSFVANVDQVSPGAATLSGPSGVAVSNDHLVVADTENHRVLVWSPVPTTTATPATLVLGQVDFSGRRPNRGRGDADQDGYGDTDSDGMFAPTGVAMVGKRLFVADRQNHRVLVFNDISTIANGAPASSVLGQPDFTSCSANRGSGLLPLANSFSSPTGLNISGDSLWVADTENNRVVRWDGATTTPVPAAVIGQTTLSALANPNAYPDDHGNAGIQIAQPTAATSVIRPRAVAVRGGNVYVSEQDSNRVRTFAFQAGAYAPTARFGQPNDTSIITNAGGLGATSLSVPQGLAATAERLFVVDSANHRVLVLEGSAPTQASRVIGQVSFFTNGFDQTLASSAGGTTSPRAIAVSNGELFVAERGRNRVLVHDLPLVAGRAPKQVYGQSDLSVALPNGGAGPGASTLASPSGVAVDAMRVVVADTANNRVLVYARGQREATLVLGQEDFVGAAVNRGAGPTAASLRAPEGVLIDGTSLVVADTGNHRVLVWRTFPTRSGQPADVVYGQTTFDTGATNAGTGLASAGSLAGPTAVLRQGTQLFVADSGNNRVVAFDIASASGAAAVLVLGQPNLTTRTPSSVITDPAKLAGPVALATDGASIYVADRDANRVVGFSLSGIASGASATLMLNANKGLVATGPAGLAVERTSLFSSRLYVADTNKDQVLVVDGVTRLR